MNQAEIRRRQAEQLSNILTLITLFVIGRLTGDNGVTYVAVAVEVCALLWTVVGGSLSDSLGRLLRSRKNRGQYKNAENMRRSALFFQAVIGLAGTLLLLIYARPIAENIFEIRYCTLIIRVLSPVLFLRMISSVLQGYFQGQGSELPTAAAGLLRQIFILGFGVLFSGMFRSYGEKVSDLLQQENFTAMYGGVGIALAICLTELFIVIFLALIYRGSSRGAKRTRSEGIRTTDSYMDCLRYLWGSRWPRLVTRFLLVLPTMFGVLFLGRALGDEAAMVAEYGMYVGKYLVICGVPVALIFSAALPVLGRTFGYMRREEQRFARTAFQSGVHVCMLHGVFAAVFIAAMGAQIVGMLCPESETVLQMLQGGSSVIVFAVLCGFFGRFLHTAGKPYLVLGAVGIADIIYVIFVVVLLNMGRGGALSLVYGGMISLFVLCIMLGMLSYLHMRIRMDWLRVLIVPLGAGGVAGLLCMLIGRSLMPHLGSTVTLIVAFVAAGLVYWILLLVLRSFREQELEFIPGGHLINMLGQMLRIY